MKKLFLAAMLILAFTVNAFWIIAVLIPITSPSILTSGPPEFPGLIETSVCIKLSYGPSPNTLPFADNIPAVTVPPRPSGFWLWKQWSAEI